MNPEILLREPYDLPFEAGQSPRGHDPNTMPDGGRIRGSAWNADWRGETFVGADYQGFGGADQFVTISQPTDWNSYEGLVVSQPLIPGYEDAGMLQEQGMPNHLRAGSTIAWPTHGQQGEGFDPILIELPHEQGMDVGWQEWMGSSQRMLFEEPPNYSEQTMPISATGYP